mmetsp:Transcript_2913/g.8917  ORF Transcript_2913/g.8917 Transcript_2913/m.8917 type:complete len:460 (-) Transcript_2913:247-1626(-)
MILRVRLPDGRTVRANAAAADKLAAVVVNTKAVKEEDVKKGLTAHREAKGSGERLDWDMSVSDLRLENGDFVFLKGKLSNDERGESSAESFNANKAAAVKCKFHGPQMVCTSCIASETKEERLRYALKDVWTKGGMSTAVDQALEAFRFVIKRQEEGRIKTAMVDNDAAFEFQAYLSKIEFQQQRCGILYGKVEGDQVVVDTIYEPPQEGTDKIFKMQTNAGAQKINAQADSIARSLGLVPVGLIFSHKMREAVLSGYDVVTAAKMQIDMESNGNAVERPFVILSVSPNEEGHIQFNSYQLSDQCLEMQRAAVFGAPEQQRRNSGKVKVDPEGWVIYKDKERTFKHHSVLVENAETDNVPTEFFLINVAIRSSKSWLRTVFPVENREIAPQMITDLSRNLNDKTEKRFVRKVSDFHLLNFLAGTNDFLMIIPGLLDMVREQRDPREEEKDYQVILESLQ